MTGCAGAMVTDSPASLMSSTMLCTSATMSVLRDGSAAASSRAKFRVAPIIASISAMVASILSRSCGSATFSARRRSRVSGVRRSCEMAASRRVRFSIRLRRRTCMSLKAREARRVSTVPVSGSGGAATSRPSRSAATASDASGAVTRRTAQIDTARMMIAMIAIETRNWRDSAGPVAGSPVANESHWPSGNGMATCRSRKPPSPCIIGPRPKCG